MRANNPTTTHQLEANMPRVTPPATTHLQRTRSTHPPLVSPSSLALPITQAALDDKSRLLAAQLGELSISELHALTRRVRIASRRMQLRGGMVRECAIDTHAINVGTPETSTAASSPARSPAGRRRVGNTVKWIIGKIRGLFHRDDG